MKPANNRDEKAGEYANPAPAKTAPDYKIIYDGLIRRPPRLRGIRPGVYRFHSHEEADAWLIKHQVPEEPTDRRATDS